MSLFQWHTWECIVFIWYMASPRTIICFPWCGSHYPSRNLRLKFLTTWGPPCQLHSSRWMCVSFFSNLANIRRVILIFVSFFHLLHVLRKYFDPWTPIRVGFYETRTSFSMCTWTPWGNSVIGVSLWFPGIMVHTKHFFRFRKGRSQMMMIRSTTFRRMQTTWRSLYLMITYVSC